MTALPPPGGRMPRGALSQSASSDTERPDVVSADHVLAQQSLTKQSLARQSSGFAPPGAVRHRRLASSTSGLPAPGDRRAEARFVGAVVVPAPEVDDTPTVELPRPGRIQQHVDQEVATEFVASERSRVASTGTSIGVVPAPAAPSPTAPSPTAPALMTPPPHLWQPVAPPTPLATLPISAASMMVGILLVSLGLSLLVIAVLWRLNAPFAALLAANAIVGYGPPLWWARRIVRRDAGGSWRQIGVAFRGIDLLLGPAAWVAVFIGQIATALLIGLINIPTSGNVDADAVNSQPLSAKIALAIVLILVAPVAEEIIFRGVILRALSSHLPIVAAIAIQGALFGMMHINPSLGLGNIGLVLVLSVVGWTLGAIATWSKRIGPTVIAHAIINALAFGIAISGFPS